MRNIIIAAVAAGAALAAAGCSTANQQWHSACTVTAKDTVYDVSGDPPATTRTKRVSTSCGSFNVEDSVAGGFNSWDMWQKLQVDKVYDIKTGGYRFGLASVFPSVIEVRNAR